LIAWQSVQSNAEWAEAGRWLSLIRSLLAVAAEPWQARQAAFWEAGEETF
jgi:hypothetical protein